MKTRDGVTVSMRKRGAVISTSVFKGFPTTFTLRRGIQFHASCIHKQPLGTGGQKNLIKIMDEQKEVCPDSNLVWAILCTVSCCVPLGIMAIVKSASVEKLWAQGRYDEARKASADARKYSTWGAIIAVIGFLLYFISMVSIL